MLSFSRPRAAAIVGCVGIALIASTFTAMPASAAPDLVTVDGMNLDSNGTAVVNDVERTDVAPGLVHVSYERLDAAGWQQIDVLKAELGDDTVEMQYLTTPKVSGGGTVTEMVEDAGAIAGVNLDHFDINNSGAAAGWGIQDGEIVKSANPGGNAVVGMTADGLGTLVDLVLEGTASFADDTAVTITGINTYAAPAGGVTLYNSQWGEYSRARAFANAADGIEVVVGADGLVQQVSESIGAGQLDDGVQVLVAGDGTAAGTRLAALAVGDSVEISYGIQDPGVEIEEAGGAWHQLLEDGELVPYPPGDAHFTGLNPRTMIGFDEARTTAYFVVVDGRTTTAAGMTFDQMAALLADLGADDGISADGGGSSQMNVREPGDAATSIQNSPSDGFERRDGDGMGFVLAQPSSGELASFEVAPASADERATRVFPGLTRTLVAKGVDESLSAVDAAPAEWRSRDAEVATVESGAVTGVETGTTTISAISGAASGRTRVEVLGGLEHVTASQTVVTLQGEGTSAVVALTGQDADGFRAPIDPADVRVDNPIADVASVEATDAGEFVITASGLEGAGTVAFEVAGHRVEVAVVAALAWQTVDDFASIDGWTTANDRAANGGISEGEGYEGARSIAITYDFTQSTSTRGRYAVAPLDGPNPQDGIVLPGAPQKVALWVKGDGNGAYLRVQVRKGDGLTTNLEATDGNGYATWTGWRRVEFAVPTGTAMPLTFQRFRVLETSGARQYTGELEISGIDVQLPPDGIEAPAVEPVQSEVVADAGATDDAPLRVAVMSDAQFVARTPNSGAVAGARDALREIVAAEPDVMIINGDFVDEAAPEDFDLARTILTEELAGADFPWYYVPGNHEVMGGAITNFEDEFGAPNHVFDMDGTRFITLNSSAGRLGSDFSQVRELRTQLDEAASDRSVTGVLVFMHHPTNDPLVSKLSQLSDRNEAAMIDDWVQRFRAESGKSIGVVEAHVGVFHTEQVDGVPYVINGNSGKSPSATPAEGGFTGWTMLGIDPSDGVWADAKPGAEWLEAEVETRVDALAVSAPAEPLVAGTVVDLDPTVTQDEGARTFDVSWPQSWSWVGDEGMFVGDVADAPAGAIAAIDPDTHELTALSAGTAEAMLTVNDATEPVSVTVTGGELSVEGEPVFDGELSAELGEWAEGASVSYEWMRDGSVIDGAESATYTAGLDDLGTTLSVSATVTRDGGAPVTVTASASGVVALATFDAPEVSVRGEAAVGGTLTADAGQWPADATLTFQWLRDGDEIEGAMSTAYAPVEADVDARLSVVVTGHRAGYEPAVATSAETEPVAEDGGEPEPEPETVHAGSVRVIGKARVGGLLQSQLSSWSGSTTLTLQWMRGDEAIPGATGRLYEPTAADVGSPISLVVLGYEVDKVSVAVESDSTDAVEPGEISVSKVTIDGKVKGARTVRADVSVKPGRADLAYEWKVGGKTVKSGGSSSLTLKGSWAGSKVKVVVTATLDGYVGDSASSAAKKIAKK